MIQKNNPFNRLLIRFFYFSSEIRNQVIGKIRDRIIWEIRNLTEKSGMIPLRKMILLKNRLISGEGGTVTGVRIGIITGVSGTDFNGNGKTGRSD
jgi:hypothetical protein